MPQRSAQHSSGGTTDDSIDSIQRELASMLGEHVERSVVEPARRARRFAARPGQMARPTTAVDLDPAVVDAITLAVDRSIAALLPGLVEDAVARVLPEAIDAAVTDVVAALSPPKPARTRAGIPRKARGA